MPCAECMVLRRQNAVLRRRIEQLRLLIQEKGGLPPDEVDDPYEDEHHPPWEKEGDELPKVPWGRDR